MEDKPHEVVTLLLARMKSNPEEFRVGDGPFPERWVSHIDMIQDFGNEVDKAALNAKLRDILMDEVHEKVMEELLNGDDRRAKEREEHEYERNLTQSLRHVKQKHYDVDRDIMVANGGTGATTKLTVGTASPDVAPSILNSMRRMLK